MIDITVNIIVIPATTLRSDEQFLNFVRARNSIEQKKNSRSEIANGTELSQSQTRGQPRVIQNL